MIDTTPGALVRYREREWVVLPSDDPDLVLLRPIGGSSREVCGVVKSLADLMGYEAPHERIEPAQFPLPSPDDSQDLAAVRLLLESARLLLRDGAAPFRSLGRLSVRPRPYQFVPLVMALRQARVRLLIADDVGVGKTIEAALIARELLDRGKVHRVAVLCPPYLCEQWQHELAEKFHIDPVVIRAGTVARLERQTPQDRSIFAHFRHFVASIDIVKGERYRAAFLEHCPDLVLVDEAHGAAQPAAGRLLSQQQRHALLVDMAKKPERNLILLSATPHSGVESSFQSLLGLLRPDFRFLSLASLSEGQTNLLARHFVQRRRADVQHWMGEDTPFPKRDPEGAEQPYRFSPAYRKFYEAVYEFAGEMVRSAETLTGWKQRMRFWSALALLRCVSSSPAAAQVALLKRAGGDERSIQDDGAVDDAETADAEFSPLIYDPTEAEAANDAPPSAVFDAQERDPLWGQSDQGRLRKFAAAAGSLRGKEDAKLQRLTEVVAALLVDGYQPIIWCRYIATADYVADELGRALSARFPAIRIVSVTGALAEDERRLKIDSLSAAPQRVLVATDCLSEGINLQEAFSAVVHYDLPWNPNRLEQREGRVDRFGQKAPVVKAIMMFGQDNPVDGAVLDVLLRKARDIYHKLGVHVPVPMDSETVMEAVLHSLFEKTTRCDGQMTLFDQTDDAGRLVRRVHDEWTSAADREAESRTRFAQRAIKPEDVERALGETDAVLGSPEDVRRFMVQASQRLPFDLSQRGGATAGERFDLLVGELPEPVLLRLGNVPSAWPITFRSPTPAGLTYIGRNHPLIEGLAEHLVDLAFHPGDGERPVARCGVIRTPRVSRRTALFLLRLRYLHLDPDGGPSSLAEETLTWGLVGMHPATIQLSATDAQQLMTGSLDASTVPPGERREVLTETFGWWPDLQLTLRNMLDERAARLAEEHGRLADLVNSQARLVQIEPQAPPDLLGLVVLLPIPQVK